MKVTFKILLLVAVIVLGYMCYKSITTPISFDKDKTTRERDRKSVV